MPFNLDSWKTQLHERMPGWQERMQQAGVGSIYAFLSAATVLPIAEAMQQGERAVASALLDSVKTGLGSNLLANTIQNWKDEADGALQLEAQIADNDELRAEIDAVLEELRTLEEARTSSPCIRSPMVWPNLGTRTSEIGQFGALSRLRFLSVVIMLVGIWTKVKAV